MQKTNVPTDPPPIAWLLLRDGHAIPLIGLSPPEIKHARSQAVPFPEAPLKHNQGLHAIVHTLGFSGDFGDYSRTGWPRLQAFLHENGCGERRCLFPVDRWDDQPFSVGPAFGPKRRHLADRVFGSAASCPARVFLGVGIDWEAWDKLAFGVQTLSLSSSEFRRDEEFVAADRDQAVRFLIDHRFDLVNQWGFLDDKLVAGAVDAVVDKTYYAHGQSLSERELRTRQILALVRAFRKVFDDEAAGWVDLLRFNDNLVILRAHDGAWDVLWRDLREQAPPQRDDRAHAYGLHPDDLPMVLLGENDLGRRLYFRRGVWEEREAHAAEQHFYDVGHTPEERAIAPDVEVRRRYLVDTGGLPRVDRVSWEGPPPDGFVEARIGDRRLLLTELVTVAEFRAMLVETGYPERRDAGDDDWGRANEGAADEAPVGASWKDALAFCAWKERQVGVALRLLTRKEHRALRPFYSERYQSLSGQDFMWESFPPRPIAVVDAEGRETRTPVPSAVTWSEPRFHPPGPDVPEFPSSNGWAQGGGRKRWITDFPPRALWTDDAWAVHGGLRFIDAWDAYEWCQEHGLIAGRFWEGFIGTGSWGAYKNVKVGFRVVIALE